MNDIDTGGPAFPSPIGDGLTIRDYFAAKALPVVYSEYWRGVNAGDHGCYPDWRDGISTEAYSLADAMLGARKS